MLKAYFTISNKCSGVKIRVLLYETPYTSIRVKIETGHFTVSRKETLFHIDDIVKRVVSHGVTMWNSNLCLLIHFRGVAFLTGTIKPRPRLDSSWSNLNSPTRIIGCTLYFLWWNPWPAWKCRLANMYKPFTQTWRDLEASASIFSKADAAVL